jgi:hypothetical protein
MPDDKSPGDPAPPSKLPPPDGTDPPTDLALVQRQATMPDAYGIRGAPEPSPDPCPECGSREVTDTDGNPVTHPRPVHVVRLKCKKGHVWSPSEAKHGGG